MRKHFLQFFAQKKIEKRGLRVHPNKHSFRRKRSFVGQMAMLAILVQCLIGIVGFWRLCRRYCNERLVCDEGFIVQKSVSVHIKEKLIVVQS